MAGEPRARTWLLYLAACALAFEHSNITIHQVLAIKQDDDVNIERHALETRRPAGPGMSP